MPVVKSQFSKRFSTESQIVLSNEDCLKFLRSIPDKTISLIVTSPPYNIGKEYEKKKSRLADYIEVQRQVITECARVITDDGSICWQVGNYVDKGAIVPLDAVLYPIFIELGLQMRNRIVWRFEHGLHCSKRFSGRYETINWFTKSKNYKFNLDPVRVPQKYPGKKYFKGPRAGQYSCNPLGKNPGDVWDIPNVKSNHVEKTKHPCQFPVELVERLVLSLTDQDDWVYDPFMGVGSSLIAAVRHERKAVGSEIVANYLEIAKERIQQELLGELKTRPMNKPVYDPKDGGHAQTKNPWESSPEKQDDFLNELSPRNGEKL